MSCFVFQVGTWIPGAGNADTTNLNANSSAFMALQGGIAGQVSFVDEVYMGGQATQSSTEIMLLAHDTIVGVTLSPLTSPSSNGPTNPSAGVLTNPAAGFIASTTVPQRATTITVAKKNFTFNSFGGIVRANYANTLDRFGIIGATQPLGELSLSSFTGSSATGAIGAHIIYETM